jgi:hypothetical protein
MLGRHAHLLDLLELGDLTAFDEELATYITAAHRIGRPHDLWRAAVMRAMRALFDGDLDEGRALARDAYQVGSRLQQSGALQALVVQNFFFSWQRSVLEPLIDSARQYADAQRNVPAWRASLAIAYSSLGRADDTREALRVLAGDGFSHIERDNLWLATFAMAAEASWNIGEATYARELRVALAPFVDRNPTLGTSLALGPVARPYGLLQILEGDLDGAVESLDYAVTLSRAMGSGLWADASRRALVLALRARAGEGDAKRIEAVSVHLNAHVG